MPILAVRGAITDMVVLEVIIEGLAIGTIYSGLALAVLVENQIRTY